MLLGSVVACTSVNLIVIRSMGLLRARSAGSVRGYDFLRARPEATPAPRMRRRPSVCLRSRRRGPRARALIEVQRATACRGGDVECQTRNELYCEPTEQHHNHA